MVDRLATSQRELSRLLRAPEGVRAALRERGDTDASSLGRWIRDDERLSAVARVDVYANAYFFRILEALAGDFELLQAAVGEAGFNDIVTAYLIARPSRKPSLRWAGEALPDFLALHPNGAPFRVRWPWAADLARLEWALSCAFDASDAPPIARDDLLKVPPEQWAALRFTLHPSASLLHLDWPVQRAWETRSADDGSGAGGQSGSTELSPEPTVVLVWRCEGMPRHRALDPEEAGLLDALAGGEAFGDLCERLAVSTSEQTAAARAASHLAGWVDCGLIGSLARGE